MIKYYKYIKELLLSFVAIVFVVYVFYSFFSTIILLTFFYNYTICKPTNIMGGQYSYKNLEYAFEYKGELYKGISQYRSCDTSQRYIVKFSYVNPKYSMILQDKQIPNDMFEIVVPEEGWEEIPNWVKDVKQDY